MYIDDNDIRSPRDRVSEDDLTRYLLQGAQRGNRTRQSERRESYPRSIGESNERNSCPCQVSAPAERETCSLCGNNRNQRDDYGKDKGKSCDAYTVPLGFPLAAVYVPVHEWRGIYDDSKAFERGTLFAELDKPLEVRGRKNR